MDLLARSGIWTFWLAAIRLISYAFKGQMDDLCRKVKWSERPEPRASNIPGLGAWTSAFARPPDRRWRITARGTLLAFRVLAAGGWKDFQHGTVRIKARTNSWRCRTTIIRVRERKDSPAQTMSSQTKNRRHRASRRTSRRPILRPASAHRESRSTYGWCRNWL
jgi:hypothetical protein